MSRLLSALLCVLALAASACSGPERVAAHADTAARPRPVKTIRIAEAPLLRTITVTGTLAAEEQVALGFKVAGRVAEVRVDLGSRVTQGQIVATLVDTDFDLRVRQAAAALTQARVRLGLSASGDNDTVVPENTALLRQRRAVTQDARLNRDRTKTFVEKGLSPRAALDSAEAALEVAEGEYQDALEEIRNREGVLAQRRSELEIARQQLQDTVLRSPLDGAVRERQVAVGEYRAPGTPLMTIVRTNPLRLQLSVPERDTPGLTTGLTARVRVEGDPTEHPGRLERIGAAILEANRTLPIEVAVPNPTGALRPGQFATAEILVSRADRGLVVPRTAIVTFAGIQKVLTVVDGRAHEQRIRTGRPDGDRIEVLDGLHGGDLVILEPGDLIDGTPVQPGRNRMKTLAAICVDRPVFAAMIVLSLVVVGAASYFRLGIDRFPRVDLPQIAVRTSLPGASVEETEVQVTEPMEEAMNTVEGIDELRSVTGAGASNVFAVFGLNRDIDVAAQDVRDRIGPVMRQLPDQALDPFVSKFNADSSPAMSIALAGNLSVRELTEIADKIVKPRIERSAGVGEVAIFGGLERAINIWVDASRLAAYRLPISDVQLALQRQNQDAPGGNVTSGAREQVLRTTGRIVAPEDFNDLVIRTANGSPVRIRDIGRAEDGTKEQRSLARLNGVPTVLMEVRRQIGANTVEVIKAVKANMARAEAQLPPGVRLEVIRDQSRYINAALQEIDKHLVLGSILACLVVFAFMRSWRSTFIAAVAIPSSVIATFGMMAALDFTLNSVTMLALVLMVGIVIDDAIVVLENIFRFVEEKHLSSFEAARQATAEIALPVLATTLCLVVIFIPVSFMSSISGRFLYQFGFTAAVAILVSLLVSFTLTPMMSARLFRDRRLTSPRGEPGAAGVHAVATATGASRKGFYRHIDTSYTRALTWALGHQRVVAVIAVGVIAAAYPLYHLVRQEYIPSDVDEAEFEMQITAPEGTSTAAMDEVMRAIDRDVRGVRGVRTVLSTTGGGYLANVNSGQAYVLIAPHEERIFSIGRLLRETARLHPKRAFEGNYSQRDVMQQIRRRMVSYRDLRISLRNIQSFNIGGGNAEIEFVLRGPELERLSEYGEALRRRAPALGLMDADVTLKLDKPELRVEIDRARAADLGVRTADIGAALRLMVGGNQEVTRYRDPAVNEEYDVELRLDERDRDDPAVIQRLYVPRSNGDLVRLDSIVRVVTGTSPSRVDRMDRQRQVSLRSSIAPGYGLTDRLQALRQAASELGMPPAYSVTVSGRARELERTFVEFGWAFLLSIVFMYIVLAAQYESLAHPFIILLALPLSLPFALASLWASGNTLNLYSALGMLVLFGVVAKNSILQVDHARNLRAAGMALGPAVLQASRDRLRPILMTTLALVGGMLPLALGTGPGAEERRAIAVVVIGGQSLSLLLTLIVTPVAFFLLEHAREHLFAARATAAASA